MNRFNVAKKHLGVNPYHPHPRCDSSRWLRRREVQLGCDERDCDMWSCSRAKGKKPRAGGCFGVMWGESKATLIAAVSDLQRGVIETSATAATAGHFIPAFIVPIPVWWDTEAEACTELGHAIWTYISNSR